MANTTNIGLEKPAGTDYALVSVLNSNSDKIDAEAGRARANFAGTYSASSAYAVGDYCTKDGNLYRCTTAIGSGGEAWNSGHWTQVAIGTEVKGLSDQISTVNGKMALQGVALTAESGVTLSLFAHRQANTNPVITINGYVTFSTAPTASTNIATVAQGSRPGSSVRAIGALADHAYDPPEKIAYVTVDTDGKLRVTPPSSNTYKCLYFSLSYYAQG